MKKQLPFICTTSFLAMCSISANAQLSIYGESQKANDNNTYTTSSKRVNYQSASDNSYNPYSYYNSYNNYNNSYNQSYNNGYNNGYNNSYNKNYNKGYNQGYNQSYNSRSNSYNHYNNQNNDLDKLGGLIEKKSSEYQYQNNILDEARMNAQDGVYDDIYEANSFSNSDYYLDNRPTFESWQNQYGNRLKVKAYRQYLAKHLGASNVPPMSQLLKTAKSWRKCGSEPYSVPPVYYWHNMLPTLRLFATLKSQGIIPQDTQITSVYRTPSLNKCAGGARGSKHKINSALDLSSPSMKKYPFKLRQVQNNICNFWLYQGRYYNFGLGLYSGGSIHIDTNKYRKWGNSHSSSSSPCRSSSFF